MAILLLGICLVHKPNKMCYLTRHLELLCLLWGQRGLCLSLYLLVSLALCNIATEFVRKYALCEHFLNIFGSLDLLM